MILTYENENFICTSTFEERHAPKKAGFRFDAATRKFYTRDIQVASRLNSYADEGAKKVLNRFLIDIQPWTGGIRYPKGLKPLHFQPGAARFALSRNRSYLALDPGLGKTIVAALIMNGSPDAWFIYICPAFLCLNVEEELTKWTTPRRPIRIYGRDRKLPRGTWIIPNSRLRESRVHHAFKMYRDAATRARKRLFLFVDEAHQYSRSQSGRSLFLYEGFLPEVDGASFMSGSPMRNRPLDLYPVLHHCAPETIGFMNEFEFGLEYCAGRRNKFGWDFKGASNVKKLADNVMGKFMLRIRDDVLGLDGTKEECLIVGEKMTPALIALDAQILKEHSPEDLMKHITPSPHVATYRKELGKLTAKAALPYLVSLMEDTEENIIVGVYHKEVMAWLEIALAKYNPVVIDGRTKTDKRVGIAKDWQASREKRLMLLQIDAGGIGLNLTKCDRMPMIEFSWVYEDNRQFYKRADRYGRKGKVYVQYCVYKNSLGRKIIEANLRKRALGENLK